MTAKNAKMLATLTVMVVVITALASMQDAFANTEPWYWTSADQHYNCTYSVTTITKTLNVNPCGDLNSSSNVWEGFSGSSWDLDPSNNGHSVYAWTTLPSGVGGETTVRYNPNTGVAYNAWIIMNKNLSWEDSLDDIFSSGYDWKTFTGHEFGHLVGIAHGSSGSVMKSSIAADWAQRNPTSHDGWHMGEMY